MDSRGRRTEKVKRIFHQFDINQDGALDRSEMTLLVVSVNPRVKFSDDQIDAILDEVFKTYSDFIEDETGLTLEGLLKTYDDGAGDVDRDFDALGLDLAIDGDTIHVDSSRPSAEPQKNEDHGIRFDSTRKLVDDLEVLIKRLRAKQLKDGKLKNDHMSIDACSDGGWSKELGHSSVNWVESGHDYSVFVKDLGLLRGRADEAWSKEEAFDGQMGIGEVLYEHHLFRDALVSFKSARKLEPTDARPHFRGGNCLYVIGKLSEAKEEFRLALDAAKAGGDQWASLLPQIHVNLGIALEGEGMILSACDHYREGALLCPSHYRALKLLGSALFGVGDYISAIKALEEAIVIKPDYADAHCDLASALHALGDNERAIIEFQKAIDLTPGHVDALYNLGGLYMDMGRYQRASEMYTRVLELRPPHWRAQLNKAVSLFGAGESHEAKKAMKEALKMTNRVEVHDAITHMKHHRKKVRTNSDNSIVVQPSKFKTHGDQTTSSVELGIALKIRSFQRLSRLGRLDVDLLMNEISDSDIPLSFSSTNVTIRKNALEVILRRLLDFLKPDTFQEAVKAINEKVLSVLDESGLGRVDIGMFYALISPVCGGPPDRRKRIAFESLVLRPINEGTGMVKESDAIRYINLLRSVYMTSTRSSVIMDAHTTNNSSTIDFVKFLSLFDWGFGIMSTLVKLESGDRVRHSRHVCAVCRYPVTGFRFKEVKENFSLCGNCYSEGKVPSCVKQEEFMFREYGSEADTARHKFGWFGSKRNRY